MYSKNQLNKPRIDYGMNIKTINKCPICNVFLKRTEKSQADSHKAVKTDNLTLWKQCF